MVTLQDLIQALSLRSVQLSPAENHVLIQRAAREMAARSTPGTVIVPLCFVLAVIVSGYFFESPFAWGSLSLVMLGSAIARRLAIKYIKRPELGSFSRWVQVFYWSCLGMAAVWGITTAIFIYADFEGFPTLLILILSAGIGAGCMVNFCIWRVLAVHYLLLSFAPPIALLIGLLPQQVTHWPALAAMVFFVVYLLLQTKQWNLHFWDALITAYLFERQTEKLTTQKSPSSGISSDETTMRGALRAAQLANEAKSEFLAGMSHELRTPMHSILSVARLGLKRVRGASREKLETYFQMIVSSGDQLLELLNDLLDLSTLESGGAPYNRQQYDLAEDLEKVVAEFRVMMEEGGISLCYQPPGCPAPAEYDKTKLYQVLRNLLTNAMKFSARHKEVKILLEKDCLKLDGMRKSAWKVTVIDQGVGIEKNEMEAVFGKFIKGSKTYPGAGGVGLGLSICQRIIEDHDGIIWAEQNVPEGAIFCFLLPALD